MSIVDDINDSGTLLEAIEQCVKRDGTDDPRPALLEFLKQLVEEVQGKAKADLIRDNDGIACGKTLSDFQDQLISSLYGYICPDSQDKKSSKDKRSLITIIATGGYGRGLLAPHSDIDLLFLMPPSPDEQHKKTLDFILYMLWDMGFTVGHAVRTLKESIAEAKADMTICTSMLDSRLIHGEEDDFQAYMTKFTRDVIKGNSRQFVQAKFAERDDRHERSGDSRYHVEPNLKEGKGGLRDIHLLQWLSTYISLDDSIKNEADDEYCVVALVNDFKAEMISNCEKFLWTTRCHLHFLRDKPDERLAFNIQMQIAELTGFSEHQAGMAGAEKFMRAYFLNSRDVGDLTRIICSALEVRHLKAQPMLSRVFAKLMTLSIGSEDEKTPSLPEGFISEHGRLNVTSPDIFKRDPINLIQIFLIAVKSGSFFHPQAYHLVRESLDLIDDDLRENPEANALFLDILMSPEYVESVLRRMTDSGVLGRFIPDFGKIDCMMQFNMYHHYTVDDHLIRAVGYLAKLDHGDMAEEHPLAHILIQTVNKRVLYVAVLLHDIAKGRKEDHSIAGASCAHDLCPRLGLHKQETDLVSWLVEHHLDMSTFAQSRDISDPGTLRDFADIVQTKTKLNMLLILTVVDIKAVGPDTWNGWKGQLLRNLYHSVEGLLSADNSDVSFIEHVEEEKQLFIEALEEKGWTETEIDEAVEVHFPSYWLKVPLEDQVEHAQLIRSANNDEMLYTNVKINAFTESTEITIYRVIHPFHLITIAAVCAAVESNITGAQILTTKKGMVLDVITLQRSFELDDDEMRRAENIIKLINQLICGEKSLEDLKKTIKPPKDRISVFSMEPKVQIDNTISEQFTVIEIEGLDRSGLLFEIASVMADLNIEIHSAHIATFGEKIVDVFYVTDLTHGKIKRNDRIEKTQQSLLKAISRLEQNLLKPH